MLEISSPYGFEIYDLANKLDETGEIGEIYQGGVQTWYRTEWQRRAGCGPTTAANLFAHISNPIPISPRKEQFLLLMEKVWGYITPTQRGVNTTALFLSGAMRYAHDHNLFIAPRLLNIPEEIDKRPGIQVVSAFLEDALAADLPIAFLNLCNGQVTNLDRWHWVTLVALKPLPLYATMCDQGKKTEIDLALWLKTSTLGGGFVVLSL